MLTSALGAGLAAWLLAALLHFAFVQNLILLGEQFESGALVHFGGTTPVEAPAEATGDHADHAAGHAHAEHGEGSAVMRNLWTAVFFGLIYVAYAMILVAGFGLARLGGRDIAAREGLLWGIAAFAAFQLAPAMGLAPVLPGTLAADLGERQVWWWSTVAATGAGLGLLAYGRGFAAGLAGAVLIGLPHVVGAPTVEGFHGSAPPELAAAFSARVLGTALAVWAVMGLVAGSLWSRPDRAA
jgi:cobalt transporter subunit CbtA